jgi:periplasmic divalent cation tolerance protein
MPIKGDRKGEGKMSFVIIYITTKNVAEARKIANTLVKEKLVACANIIPKIESTYWWKGKIEKSNEATIILKTKKKLVKDVIKRVKELHSYTVPCIITIPITGGNKDFLNWINEVVK